MSDNFAGDSYVDLIIGKLSFCFDAIGDLLANLSDSTFCWIADFNININAF